MAWDPRNQKPARALRAAGGPSGGTRSPHILASPPGTAAPIDAINYTPKTGEVHQPGVLAPVGELNYSLLPGDQRVGDSMGMGSGAAGMPAPPIMPGQERLTGRYAAPPSMASGMYQPGTPPMRPSPYSTGPGPRSAPSGPTPAAFSGRSSMRGTARGWGMGNEMGAGATGDVDENGLPTDSGDIAALQDLVNQSGVYSNDSTGADGGPTPTPVPPTPGSDTLTDPTGTQHQAQPPAAPAAPSSPPATSWAHDDTSKMQVGDIVWYTSPDGKTRLPMGRVESIDPNTRERRITSVPLQDQSAIIQAMGGVPQSGTKTPTLKTTRTADGKEVYAKENPDGTLTPITDSSGNPVLTGSQPAAPKAPTSTNRAGQVYKLPGTNLVGTYDANGKWVYDPTLSQQAADSAAAAKSSSVSGSEAAAAIRAASAAQTSKTWSVTTAPDGGLIAVNLNDPTQQDSVVKLTPADPKNGIYQFSGGLVKLSDDGKSADTLYTPPPNWSVTTSGGTTIAYDQTDPTKHIDLATDPTYLPAQQATTEYTKAQTAKLLQDAQTGKITAEDARQKLAIAAHDILHPQVTDVGGNLMIPSGASIDVNYQTRPGGPQRGTQHFSGGPLDADAIAVAKQINDFLTGLDQQQQTQVDKGAASGSQAAAAQSQAQANQDTSQSGAPPPELLPPGQAGVPGQDPRLSGQAQPPHNVTTAAGDIAQYDAGGQLTGIRYINTAPPHYGEPGYPGSDSPEVGSTLDVGVTSDDSGGGDTSQADDSGGLDTGGAGQDTFSGRGLTPETGRGSTGIGWQPKAPGWNPMGMGMGADFNPLDPSTWGDQPDQPADDIKKRFQDAMDALNRPSEGGQGPQEETPQPPAGPDDEPEIEWMNPGGWPPLSPNPDTSPPPDLPPHQLPRIEDYGNPTMPRPNEQPVNPDIIPGLRPGPEMPPTDWGDRNNSTPVQQGPGATDQGVNWTPQGPGGHTPGAAPQPPKPAINTGPGPGPIGHTPGPQIQMPGVLSSGNLEGDPLYQLAMQITGKRGAGAGHMSNYWQPKGYGSGQGPGDMGAAGGPTPPPAAGGAPPGAPPPGGQGWTPPVPPGQVAGIGHRFGQQMNEGEPQHSGVDLQAVEGSQTVSPVDGVVERVEHNPQGLGLTVVVRGKDGSEHRLGHLSSTHAYPGMQVAQGQDLAKVGSSGNTTGSHLHWGVKDPSGQPQDPTGALPPQLQQAPPVPGTEMMGPPGGTGGAAQMGGGHSYGAGQSGPGVPGMPSSANTQSPDYQQGYQDGMSAARSPGTPPMFIPGMRQPTPSMADQQDQGGGDPSQMGGGHTSAGGRGGGGYGGGGGAGQDNMDTRWDLYEAKDTSGFWGPPGQPAIGSGGEGGMGAGGVYVKSSDGSMHWDETAIDPNPNGGSVVVAGTQHNPGGGTVVTGANRQSGPTGPGGTGPPGSQARADAVATLQANPTFSSGTSGPLTMTSGAAPTAAQSPYGQTYGQDVSWTNPATANPAGVSGTPGAPGSTGTVGGSLAATNPLTTIQQQMDPWDQSVLSKAFDPTKGAFDPTKSTLNPTRNPAVFNPVQAPTLGSTLNVGLTDGTGNEMGSGQAGRRRAGWTPRPLGVGAGGEGGMGAGDANTVDAATTAQLDNALAIAQKYVDAQNNQAQLTYNAAIAQVNANLAAEANRHAEAIANLQQQTAFHADDVALKQQEDAENQRHNQATEALQAQATQAQVTMEGMREQNATMLQSMQDANQIKLAQMQEGTQVYLQQGQQAFQAWQSTQADRMAILSSALQNPWLQQLTGMSPAPGSPEGITGGINLANLIQQIQQPFDPSQYGMQNAPTAMNAPGSTGGGPGVASAQGANVFAGQQGAPQIDTPSWSQWQGWDPFQKAAYRTNIEALGPGVWNQVQSGLSDQFSQAGGNPNITQMQAASATPEQSAGQQMTANVFGETVPQWQQNQQKQWSQAQASNVKSNLAGIAA